MKNTQIKVKDILKKVEGILLVGDEELVLENFSKDTRTIKKGDVYVAIRGEKFNGNDYFRFALDKGAIAVIIDNSAKIDKSDLEKYKNKTIIQVRDTVQAIGIIAKYKRELYDIPVVAITGSVGKTSTKDLIASVVSSKFKTLKTQGNMNNNIGLPFTILNLKDHEAVVIEMGMNNLGEISYLANIAKPTIAVITNIGTAHIGNLGSRENILKAKLEILEGLNENGILILNNDNDMLNLNLDKIKEKNINVVTFGIENKSDYMAKDVKLNEFDSNFKINNFKVEVPVGGIPFVYNSLAGIAVGEKIGIDMERILTGIKGFELTKNRMDIEKSKNGVIIINGTYNASYDSIKPSLEYLNNLKVTRKIAVLGDVLELGEFSKDLHKKIGEEVYRNNIDILITSGENSINTYKRAIELGLKKENSYHFKNVEDIIEFLKKELKPNDAILVKASNAMGFNKIVNEIK